MSDCCVLLTALRAPSSVKALDLAQWDLLLRQARRAGLLALLGWRLDLAGVGDVVPPRVRSHVHSDQLAVAAQNRAVAWEVHCLQRSLSRLGLPLILLKGAAYVVADHAMSVGRMFNDVDILVPQDRLDELERALHMDGWGMTHLNSYDQRFYREWMHELPPMQHSQRGTSLDVHHNIIPLTSRYRVDASQLLSRSCEIEGMPGVRVLAPEDRVLHSAAHLLLEGEFDRGLRDLLDVVSLIEQFAADDPGFWSLLVQRAGELGLQGPLYFAVQAARRLLLVDVPEQIPAACADEAGPAPWRWLLLQLYLLALRPAHPSCDLALSGVARWLLYVRSHAIKMPLWLLIPHLVRKAWRRRVGDSPDHA